MYLFVLWVQDDSKVVIDYLFIVVGIHVWYSFCYAALIVLLSLQSFHIDGEGRAGFFTQSSF